MNEIYFKFAEKLISHKCEIVVEFIAENPHRDSNETKELCMSLLYFIENKHFMQELFKKPVDNPTSIFACCDSFNSIPKDLNSIPDNPNFKQH